MMKKHKNLGKPPQFRCPICHMTFDGWLNAAIHYDQQHGNLSKYESKEEQLDLFTAKSDEPNSPRH